ncbi:MAG: glycosyl transferase [Anaerolineales bacterium]|nr:glycosyltransferase family 2 protein [Anaerolineae bacterium]PWB55133.1 MAG: glycosyl transferase [Anaerolineales bacterium]
MKLSIIIPAYNEADSLEKVVEGVYAVNLGEVDKEVIISNDGSRDRSQDIIQDLQARYPGLIAYHSPTNLGKGAAVRLGIAISSGDIITIQDADMELDPSEYPRLLSPLLDQRARVVYGSRFLHSKVKLNRTSRLANRFLTTLSNLLFGGHLTDMETAYKMFYREALDGIRLRCVRFDFEPEITSQFLKKGYQILEVPITYSPRTVEAGKKISWVDGYEAIYTLIRCRFFHRG